MKEKDHLDADAVLFGGVVMHVEHFSAFIGKRVIHVRILRVMVGVAKFGESFALRFVDLGKQQQNLVPETHLFLDALQPCGGLGHGVNDFQFGVHGRAGIAAVSAHLTGERSAQQVFDLGHSDHVHL